MNPSAAETELPNRGALMKICSAFSLVLILAVTVIVAARAQQLPVVGVDITEVAVAGAQSDKVIGFTVTSEGSGYSSAPTVALVDGGGTNATATAELTGRVSGIVILDGGSGYISVPTVTITGGGGRGAAAVAGLTDGVVTSVTLTSRGSGYTSAPIVTLTGGGGSGANVIAGIENIVARIVVDNPGSNYHTAPNVVITGGGGSGASATAVLGTSFIPPNESYGTAGSTIWITALGRGTFLESSFTYSAYVNGVHIGTSTEPIHPPTPFTIPWAPPQPGVYYITVKITDGQNEATSLPVRYFATGTVVNSPMTGTLVPQGSSVVLKADVTAPQGFIKEVQFYANGQPIGESDKTYPYSLIYTPTGTVTGTTYAITAEAWDNEGQSLGRSSPAVMLKTVTAISNPPTSIISTPEDGAAIAIPSSENTDISIVVDAHSQSGFINKVELYIDGMLFGTKTTYPYIFTWHPQVVGKYRLVALTYDDKNNVVASTANLGTSATPTPTTITIAAPPNVTITAPTNGSTVTGEVPISLVATATDPGGSGINSVQFFVDSNFVGVASTPKEGSKTYSVNAVLTRKLDEDGSPLPSLITAMATNGNGISAISDAVSVNVTNGGEAGGGQSKGKAPTVALTAPETGDVIAVNSTQTLTANASDPDGNIVGVKFTVNGTVLGTDSEYPYSFTWKPTSPGPYEITATATDNDGNSVTSEVVTVMVGSEGDAVYTGSYQSQGESGVFALFVSGGKLGTFIARSAGNAFYYYPDIMVTGGRLEGQPDASIQGTVSETGASGTFDHGRLFFIGPVVTAPSASVRPGLYTGNVTGRSTSTLTVIVAGDGSLALSLSDGSDVDVGVLQAGTFASGGLGADGSFTVSTAKGATVTGKIDPVNGFLTATVLGGPMAGSVTGALSSGGAFSDGALLNVSTRGQVGAGERILIAGFVVSGATSKTMLIRAVGPSLDMKGALPNPKLTIFRGNVPVAENDDWSVPAGAGAADATAIANAADTVGAARLAPGTRDAAVLTTLAPGIYTAQVSSADGASGVALVEVYDAGNPPAFSPEKVVNISTRGDVGTGDNVLIAGFVISGHAAKKVLIRASGPALAPLGVNSTLPNPMISLYRGQALVRENDDWDHGNSAALVSAAAGASGASPAYGAGGKDAAILLSLPPGIYTAVVRGVGDATGVALVEVYEVP